MVRGSHPEFLVEVGNELYCDGVGDGGRFPLSRGLQREAPTRSENCEEVSVVVRGVAGVLRPHRLPRVPCFLEGVGDVKRVAPPRTLVSSSVGVVGASSAWFLVGVVVVMAERRTGRARG